MTSDLRYRLASPDLYTRLAAESAAITVGNAVVHELISLLEDTSNDTEARWRAAVVLGEIGHSEALSALLNAAVDSDWDVRHSAVWSLGFMPNDERAFAALQAVATQPKLDEQINYVAAMRLLDYNERGHSILQACASDPGADPNVATWARSALANIHYRSNPIPD